MDEQSQTRLDDWLRRHGTGRDGRIPAERVLAAELGLSRARLRLALAALEAEGRLVRHVGRGTFLVNPSPPGSGAGPLDPTSAELVDSLSPREVLEAGLTLEPELARRATFEASGREVAALREAERAVADASTWIEWDVTDRAFHRAIAACAGNQLLLDLFDRIAAMRAALAWGRLAARGSWPPDARPFLAGHAEITEAIADRDGDRAAGAVRNHLLQEAEASLGSARGLHLR